MSLGHNERSSKFDWIPFFALFEVTTLCRLLGVCIFGEKLQAVRDSLKNCVFPVPNRCLIPSVPDKWAFTRQCERLRRYGKKEGFLFTVCILFTSKPHHDIQNEDGIHKRTLKSVLCPFLKVKNNVVCCLEYSKRVPTIHLIHYTKKGP